MPLQPPDGKKPEGIATRKTYAIAYPMLVPNPNNPRDLTSPEEQDALAELVADLMPGFDPDRPLLVKEIAGGKYMTWDGNRRWHALAKVIAANPDYGLIPCVKVPAGTDEVDLEYYSLRSPSRPLSALSEANQIYRLIRLGQTETAIAHRLHKPVTWVKGRLELREAPPEIREAVNGHQIAPTEARKLLRTSDPVGALQDAQRVAGERGSRVVRPRDIAPPRAALTAEQKAIQAFLTAWDDMGRRAPVLPEVVAAKMERLRELVP